MPNLNRPVQTRSGKAARIICRDAGSMYGAVPYPIIALVTETVSGGNCREYVRQYTATGRVNIDSALIHPDDLVNIPLVQERWAFLDSAGELTGQVFVSKRPNQANIDYHARVDRTLVKVRVEVVEE